MSIFEQEYKKLNKEQKDAVDSIDGPVMVVAGPGTGKTQLLTLRIGNILQKTDTDPSSILCLTFTNSGVVAMKTRLEEYIGTVAHKVRIATFHSFAMELVEANYDLLDFSVPPKLLGDDEAVFLVDDLLENNEWQHIRPRTDSTMYFNSLKQLISILKKERLTPEEFLVFTNADIELLKNDPDSISSRGESKGKLKKEIEKKIESLERTLEVVEFYRLYEEKKKELGFMDYDDVLEYAVLLVERYEDVRATLRENYHYVLVDEHQDSSGVQNNFLKGVWKDTELPNILVVGDDRQLIYAFSGASLSYFEEFSHIFGKAKLIVLSENYRSTENILKLADDLLESSITKEKLRSNTKINNKILLNEYTYQRDEIIGAGLYFKQKISEGVDPKECALLVPKNYNVRSAISILRNSGLPVSSGKNASLFATKEGDVFFKVLSVVKDPLDSVTLSSLVLEKYSGVDPISAHKFLKANKPDKITLEDLIATGSGDGLWQGENPIAKWGTVLKNWTQNLSYEKLSLIVSTIGNELLIHRSETHEELCKNVEIVRSFIHLAILFEGRNINGTLADFIKYLRRLESYGTHISVATFGVASGVQVMTLHKSKGMEYKVVWIAHMNEETLMAEKKNSFTLPEKVKEHIEERSIETAKRELYVAITRAREYCVISYAGENYNGVPMELAHIIRELPSEHFIKKNKQETEEEILKHSPEVYTSTVAKTENNIEEDMKIFVKENYSSLKVTVTMLNNFFECPRKWYFRNFLKLPEVKGVSLALGSAVHSSVEFILKNKSLPSDKELNAKIEYELHKEGVEDGAEFKKLAKDARKAVDHFIEGYYNSLEKDYVSERPLQFRDPKFPDLLMYGKLDLTERSSSGEVTVTDFKTGSSKTKGVIEKLDEENRMSSYLRQLTMYSYLISGAEGGKSALACRLLFLESAQTDKNALYSIHIEDEHIDMLLRDINDYQELVRTGEWMNRPCNTKSYGSDSSSCEYCKIVERYK